MSWTELLPDPLSCHWDVSTASVPVRPGVGVEVGGTYDPRVGWWGFMGVTER